MTLQEFLEIIQNLPPNTEITFYQSDTIFLDHINFQIKNMCSDDPPSLTLFFTTTDPNKRGW